MARNRNRPRTVRATLDRVAWIWIALAPWIAVVGVLLGAIDRPRPQETGSDPARAIAPGAPADPRSAGSGALFGRTPDGWTPLDLLATSIRARVAGAIARTTVTQSFRNDTAAVLEAVYVFPLPEGAAVHAMEMRVGERRIVSVVREREDARRTYEVARAEGRKAALVEEGRPNLFRTSLANLAPGETVDVELSYVHETARNGDTFSVTFPLAYVPRYGPAAFAAASATPGIASAVPAADRGPAGSPPAPAASIEIRLDAGLPLESVDSPTHAWTTHWEGDDLVVLPGDGTVPADRDVVVRWSVAPAVGPRVAVHVEDRADGRYALVQVLPPDDLLGPDEGLPTETLFVVDVSGSMAGPSLAQAKAALHAAVGRLRDGDAFDVLAFSTSVRAMAGRFVAFDAASARRASGWIDALEADGGTDVLGALRAALDHAGSAEDAGRVRRIVFLTDGAIGAEQVVLREIVDRLDGIRLHAVGIGPAPNRWLMREMARRGRGLCTFVHDVARAGEVIDRFFGSLARPVLSSPAIAWVGAQPESALPAVLPDLHAGEALTVVARFPAGATPTALTLSGSDEAGAIAVDVPIPAARPEEAGVAFRWARARVDDLVDAVALGAAEDAVRPQVVEIALAHGLVTRYTSRVAVESFPTVSGDAVRVDVPGALAPALPRGGTLRPLARVLGWTALLAGLAALGALRRGTP